MSPLIRRGTRRGLSIPRALVGASAVGSRAVGLIVSAATRRLRWARDDGVEFQLETLTDLNAEGHGLECRDSLDGSSLDRGVVAWDTSTRASFLSTVAEIFQTQGFSRNFVHFFDDFATNNQSGVGIGWLPWFQTNNQGTGTIGLPGGTNAFGQWSEFGVIDFTSGANSGDNSVWHLGINSRQTCQGPPPTGSLYEVKVQIPTASPNGERWCGMVNIETTYPDAALANTIRMIGFVTRPTGSAVNWFGICRNGTVETTIDMGVSANTTWRTFRWRKTATGVEFLRVAGDVETAVGVITTNLPATTTNQIPMFGVRAGTAAAQALRVDYVGIAAKLVRN